MTTTLDVSVRAVLDAVADALPGGSVNAFDRDLRYVYAAGPGLANVGLAVESLIGQTLSEVFGPAQAALVEPHYRRAFDGERVTFDLTVFDRTFSVTATPFTAPPSSTILVLVQDVTRLRAESGEHQRRDVLVATVAHELRQPIGPLRTALELLKRDDSPVAKQRLTGIIERQVQVLERLVADLGAVGHDVPGAQLLRIDPIDVKEVLMDAVQAIRHLAQDRQQAVVTVLDDTLRVYGDEVRLRQVFSNLLLNATNYTPAGGRIEIHGTRAHEQVIVRVSDTGRGIRPELLPRIFDLFVRGDEGRGGMGIGLNVVRRLVEAHGGRIEARSEGEGRGSHFTVMLPTGD